MPNKNLPTVVRGSTSQDKYYDHNAYLEHEQQPYFSPQTIEIDPDTGQMFHSAFTAYDGAQEQTSSKDRAEGLRIRLTPLFVILLVLAIGVGLLVVVLTDIKVILVVTFGAILFAGMCLVAYNRESLRDYGFSRAGLERHRIDVAAGLKEQELDYQFQLKRELLQHHVRMLEAMEHDDQTD